MSALTTSASGGLLDIGTVVAQVKDLLDRLESQGKLHIDATISHPALKDPISVNLDLPLPPKANKMAYSAPHVADNFAAVFADVRLQTRGFGTDRENALLDNAVAVDHPVLWHRLRTHAARVYRHDTGRSIVGAIDWNTVKQWLHDHWPQIVSMFCSIIMVFLMI